VAARATRGVSQSGLVERRDLDQLGQFDPLHQQLCDAIAAPYRDRLVGVEVDQCHLDLAAVSGVDRSWRVHDRKPNAGSQSRPRVDESNHAVRDRNGDPGGNEGSPTGTEDDVDRAKQVDTGITFVGPGRHG